MTLELHELISDAEFPPIVAAEHESCAEPFNGLCEILEGPSREECTLKQIADQLPSKFFAGRLNCMSKPHFLISYCFVLPSYRHRSAASLMMEWGTKKADEMGLESFVESTEDGRRLYGAHGFKV
ncbi:hypothetical protein OIDMADRAFT_131423 [Oidiodendron maius Zn]|uniref:N-acetyltransferase domain-containing protein n=1 Tax=Oidiodendron maius (strain Zn) TaxID=913774 RepID=A0A0C3GKX7_OIDMZ|nr:hypothetical protein OIDMADRAFT_131423 [Oidiodendron maius Zn]